MTMEAEQLAAEAARLQLTWHYARLLTTEEHRRDALLKRNLGAETPDEVAQMQAALAALHRDVAALRASADQAGVLGSELERVLGALERERRLLARLVADDLRALRQPPATRTTSGAYGASQATDLPAAADDAGFLDSPDA